MVLRLRYWTIAASFIGASVTIASAQQIAVPPEVHIEAKRWLAAALDPLAASTPDNSHMKFERRYDTLKGSVCLFYNVGMVGCDRNTLSMRGVSLSSGLRAIVQGRNSLTAADVISRCQGFVSKVFDQVPAMNWSSVRPKLNESDGTWQLFPRCVANDIPFRSSGILFIVNGADGKIKSASIERVYPPPPVEQYNAPIITPESAKRFASEALLSSGCAFNVNILKEPNLCYDIPNFGPFPSQYSERHLDLRRRMTAMKTYIVSVLDGESWNPRERKYDDELYVFVDAITGEPMCVTQRFSMFRFGSIKKASKSVPDSRWLGQPLSLQRGASVVKIPESSITSTEILASVVPSGFVWLHASGEVRKLFFDKEILSVWIEDCKERIGGTPNKSLTQALRKLAAQQVTMFGGSDKIARQVARAVRLRR